MALEEAKQEVISTGAGRVSVIGGDVLVFSYGNPEDFLKSTLGEKLAECCHEAGQRLHVNQDFPGVRVAPLTGK